MKRATRLRLGLAMLVVVLASAVAATRWYQASHDTPQTLLPLAGSAVTRVSVQTRNGPLRRFAKRDGRWWMLTPRQGRANDAHLQRLAGLAAAKVAHWRPAADLRADKIGLDPPWATVRVNGTKLELGTLAALAPQRYVRIGDHVALIPARYAADIAAKPASELAHAGSTLPSL